MKTGSAESVDPVLAALGARVRKVRSDRNLTQDQLAGLSEVHRITIGLVERGKKDVQVTTLVRLAAALEVPVGDLLC